MMTTWTLLVVACVVLIVIRFGVVRSTKGPAGWLSATLVVLFPALLTQLPSVIAALDGPTMPGFASALGNAFTIVALAIANCAYQLTVDPARRARVWLGASLGISVAIMVSFVVFGSNYPEFLATLSSDRPVPPVGVYTYIYVVSLLWMAAGLTVTGVRLVWRRPKLSVWISLGLLALCSVSTIVYGVARLVAIATYQLGFYIGFLHGPLIGWLMRLCVVSLLLGLLVAVFGPRLGIDRWQEKRSLRRTLEDLFPLWSALRDRYPEIVLERDSSTPRLAVYRRMIEIWDGLLLLRPHMETSETCLPRAEAERIAKALEASRNDAPARALPAPTSHQQNEVEWLTSVSREFSRVTP